MKKGFTITELLVVIVIIGIIVVLVSTNLLSIEGSQKEKEYENYVMTIENAACVYIEKTDADPTKEYCKANGCEVKTETLIEEGLLDEKLENPKNREDFSSSSNDQIVKIEYKDNVKTCELEGK